MSRRSHMVRYIFQREGICLSREQLCRQDAGPSSAMTRRVLGLSFFFLAVAGLPLAGFSAPQILTKCTARSKPLTLLKGRPQKIAGTVPGRSTIEYHVKIKTDMNVNIKLTNFPLKLDL